MPDWVTQLRTEVLKNLFFVGGLFASQSGWARQGGVQVGGAKYAKFKHSGRVSHTFMFCPSCNNQFS